MSLYAIHKWVPGIIWSDHVIGYFIITIDQIDAGQDDGSTSPTQGNYALATQAFQSLT